MRWTKATIKTTTEAVDYISAMLDELGIEGIEIEDNVPLSQEDKEKMFIDFLPEMSEDVGEANVNFYMDVIEKNNGQINNMGNEIESQTKYNELIEKVKEGLKEISQFVNIGSGEIIISETEEIDWINNWKEFFKPFRLYDNILIKPTWEKFDKEKEDDIIIEIDPGTSFGTGLHETTKLCVMGMKKYINSDTKLIDVGCGSGILLIIGMKLGAKSALGIDIDPIAVEATKENIKVNGLKEEQVKILDGDIITNEELQKEVGFEEYDVVVANILADVIIPLSSHISKYMKKNGVFISSGIIDTKKDEVQDSIINAGLKIVETNQMGDWISFVAVKP